MSDTPAPTRMTQRFPHGLTTGARRRIPFTAIFALWTLWGLWTGNQSLLASFAGGPPPAPRANPLALALAGAWLWALLTPGLIWSTRRIHDSTSARSTRLAAHVAIFAIVHVIDVTFYWFASDLIASNPRPWFPLLFSLVSYNALTYIVVAVAITALDAREALRAREARENQLETQLALAQFHALRAQLHPHFLFNALNAISSLIHSDPARADRMLARVSDLLRIAIDTAVKPEIPLADEVEFAKRYLEIERMRYGDRLDVRVDIGSDTAHALVPNMLLQPLIENAVRHGVAPHSTPGRVEVRSARVGDDLSIVVTDTGDGFDDTAETRDPPGVGISTTRARLETLYGASQQLVFVNVPGGFETRISLPFHSNGAAR
jgi:sensor histidine kinase YesM